jgi:peptidoglycan-associated lipoprotein
MQTRALRILTILVAIFLLTPSCSKKPKTKSPADVDKAPASVTEESSDDQDQADDGASAAAATPASVEAEPELKTTYFEFDSSTLSESARDKLVEGSRWLKRHPDEKLVIEGHTCEIGTPEYNLALGERRAKAVRDYLYRLGVDASRLKIISFGEEKPADEGQPEMNRRAELEPRK